MVPKERKDRVKKLKEMLAGVDQLYLATDEDREGESIAWHLTEALKPKVPVHRMVFHEITQHAIEDAFANPRDLDLRLVQAQEARRILDRLYGFEVSPVLWRKVQQGLSAGRVQSVAVRIVVERERERMAFTSADYWSLEGIFAPADDLDQGLRGNPAPGRRSPGRHRQGVRRGRTGRSQGRSSSTRSRRPHSPKGLLDSRFEVQSVEEKPYKTVALSAVSDLDPAAGGGAEASLLVVADDVGGAASLRERVHHLHADRLDVIGRFRRGLGSVPDRQALRAGVPLAEAAGLSPPR